MRVHLLGVPNTETTKAYVLDGFCQMTIRFASLLKRLGHTVILYGGEANEAPCDRHVVCISKAEQTQMLGAVPYQSANFDAGNPLWLTFNARAAASMTSFKEHKDVIATITGTASLPVHQQHPELMFLEYSIGYRGVCAPYRVYQSHAWRHVVHGFTGCDGGREFDAVIPPFFEVSEFPTAVTYPKPYVVYCGRIVPRKGISVVCDAAKAAGLPLKFIGHGDPKIITYGEYLGELSNQDRNDVIAQAQALLMPTQYIEPFGNVAAEAQLCGTPVIASDYGAFTESVEQGVSGYRCTYLGEYVEAIKRAESLDRHAIQARARRLYSVEAAERSYRAYFNRLSLLWDQGWNSLEPGLAHVNRQQELEAVA